MKKRLGVPKGRAKRKIQPELLPAAEDVKKIERRTAAEAAERLARTGHLELPSQGGDRALQIVGPL